MALLGRARLFARTALWSMYPSPGVVVSPEGVPARKGGEGIVCGYRVITVLGVYAESAKTLRNSHCAGEGSEVQEGTPRWPHGHRSDKLVSTKVTFSIH